MPRRTNAFQRLILLINASLADGATVEESALLPDSVTGNLREVDILVTAQVAAYTARVAIEVVGRSRKSDTTWVESMRAKHENLPTDKLILVSEKGFAKTAKAKARFYGIETMTLEAARSTDWGVLANLTATGTAQVMTIPFDCSVVCAMDDGSQDYFDMPNSAIITHEGGTLSLDAFVRRILGMPDFRNVINDNVTENGNREFWFAYTEPAGLWQIAKDGRSGQVTELRVGLHVTRADTPVEFASGNYARSTFISARSRNAEPPLHFVLVRREDGTVTGTVLDEHGARPLSLTSAPSVPAAEA